VDILVRIFVRAMRKQSNNKMKNTTQNTSSQLDKANTVLRSISRNVTTDDRDQCGFSEYTVVQYLKGRGKDLGTAMKLIEFFSKRIEERDKKLASAEDARA
jgi:hypothetical protein